MMLVTQKRRKVVVVGGGITGLTAAFYMQKEAIAKELPLDIVLVESSLRLGGKIQTLRKKMVLLSSAGQNLSLIVRIMYMLWQRI